MFDFLKKRSSDITPCSRLWNQIYIKSGSRSISNCCFRPEIEVSLDTINEMGPNIFSFHPKSVADRKHFLSKTDLPSDCSTCKINWNSSKKVIHNEWRNQTFSKKQLKSLEKKDLLNYFEFHVGRTCNLSCIYCSPTHSTKWQKLLGQKIEDTSEWDQAIIKNFYLYLENRLKHSTPEPILFSFGGGEPFLNDSFFEMIDRIIFIYRKHNMLEIENRVQVISNLSLPEKKIEPFIKIAQKHPNWHWIVTGSLDAVSSVGEGIRPGLSVKKFQDNLHRLASSPPVKTWVLPSITSISLPETPELLRWSLDFIDEHKLEGEDFSYCANLVTTPQELHISTLPQHFKSVLDECIDTIKGTSLERDSYFFESLYPIIGTRRSPEDLTRVTRFFRHMSLKQNKDYFELFPILDTILDPRQ